jgi:hypothetical protein
MLVTSHGRSRGDSRMSQRGVPPPEPGPTHDPALGYEQRLYGLGPEHSATGDALMGKRRVRRRVGRGYLRRPGIGYTVIGAFLLVLGIVTTVGTYVAASAGTTGGVYAVSWGLIAVGGLTLVRGLMRLRRSVRLP